MSALSPSSPSADAINKCQGCGGASLTRDSDTQELFCSDCGVVNDGSFFVNDLGKDSEGKTMPPTVSDKHALGRGLGTVMMGTSRSYNKDSHGGHVDPKIVLSLHRASARSVNRRDYVTRMYVEVMRASTSRLDVSESIKNAALEMTLKTIGRKHHQGITRETMCLAHLYLACRMMRNPLYLTDFSRKTGCSKAELIRALKQISKYFPTTLPVPESFIPNICDALQLPPEKRKEANDLIGVWGLKRPTEDVTVPQAVAATAVYCVCRDSHAYVSQEALSRITGVSQMTIRTVRRKFKERGVAV